MCSKAGRNRKSLPVEKKLERPTQLSACTGQGQVHGVHARCDSKEQEQPYVHGYEDVAGALATTNPPAPGRLLAGSGTGRLMVSLNVLLLLDTLGSRQHCA